MKLIPSFLLKQLYTRKSLTKYPQGVSFQVKNRLKDAVLLAVSDIRLNKKPVAADKVYVMDDGKRVYAKDLEGGYTLDFPLRKSYQVYLETNGATAGFSGCRIDISFKTTPFGWLDLSFEDEFGRMEEKSGKNSIPRNELDDYSEEAVEERRRFMEDFTGVAPEHIPKPTYDSRKIEGNCENFIGMAQVPLGLAGPFQINGTHAQGQFLVPMATTEGTLLASYNRGMKLLNSCGGVNCTVQDDAMQRAPCFVLENAQEAVKFRSWLQENLDELREATAATSGYARLLNIETYLAAKFVYCRFNYSTGDAAGQNMVTLATYTACNMIVQSYPAVKKFVLESNMGTDKKPSYINMLRTRGKRVAAEAVLKKEVLQEYGADPEQLHYFKKIGDMGSFMSGSLNNSLHAANALAAIFIATGQDVANIAESCVGIGYSEPLPNGDLYVSITLPSLIVGTHGGGTALPAQRECLQMMDCYGEGKVNKLAEIVAGVVLAGELSLGLAVVSLDWVNSHEKLGRNR